MLTEFQRKKFTNHFHIRDTDNDGIVTLGDYHQFSENVAAMLEWAADSPEKQRLDGIHQGVWTFFWKPADSNDNDQVSLEEHLNMMNMMILRSKDPEVLAASEKHSVGLFEAFDFDGDGKISATEYKQFFQAAGMESAWSQESFAKMDTDNDGMISREEFVMYHQQFFSSDDPAAPGNWFYGPLN